MASAVGGSIVSRTTRSPNTRSPQTIAQGPGTARLASPLCCVCPVKTPGAAPEYLSPNFRIRTLESTHLEGDEMRIGHAIVWATVMASAPLGHVSAAGSSCESLRTLTANKTSVTMAQVREIAELTLAI